MSYKLLDPENISASYRYGNIELHPAHLVTITRILNMKKHWWSRKEDKVLTDVIKHIFELVEVKMGFFPNGNNFNIVFVEGGEDLDKMQETLYDEIRHREIPAFASLTRNTMYMRIDTLNRKVMMHEFAHLLFHRMLHGQRVSYNLHERVAQFGETC